MKYLIERAHMIYYGQRSRNTVEYNRADFTYWWIGNYKKKKWKRPHCGRIDHSKGYSFGNIVMQEQADNNRERNERRGNPGKTHRAVKSYTHDGKFLKKFKSKREAAKHYGVNEKTIWNHCHQRSIKFHNGPIRETRKVTFKWA